MQQVLPGKKGVYLYETTGTNVLHPNGRFSVVFKGIESETRQPVVIKQLHPRHRGNSAEWKRFRREFEAHPGLSFLPAHMEWIEFENHFFIIREFIPGVDFRNFISTSAGKKIKTIEEKIRFFIFLCQTVQQLHESGFIHGDIKPSNFIIQQKEQKPEIKMIDLGLAGKREEFSKSTRDENSPLPFAFHYSAPELMLNHPQLVCEATDVFSLGIMLYEWLNGSPAWFNQHPAALTNLQLTQPLPKS
ncbi:MAG: lipopolysaccharide core heptose(II) kinase RfaY, partial [Bacteroidota bacterium]